MTTCKTYEFEVAGVGEFPVDMLRYDGAWPADPKAVEQITESLTWLWRQRYAKARDEANVAVGDEFHTERKIELRSHREPTDARWRSFGWTCSVLAIRR